MATKPAFIVHGTWSAETRKHEALRFLESVVNFVEGGDFSTWSEYYTEDFSGITPYGESMGFGNWGKALASFYAGHFSAHRLVPYTQIVLESGDGYDVYALSNLYANLQGEESSGKEKVTDEEGREWDIRLPNFYRLDCAKVEGAPHEGLKLRHAHWMQDTKMPGELARERGVEAPRHVFALHRDHHEHFRHVK